MLLPLNLGIDEIFHGSSITYHEDITGLLLIVIELNKTELLRLHGQREKYARILWIHYILVFPCSIWVFFESITTIVKILVHSHHVKYVLCYWGICVRHEIWIWSFTPVYLYSHIPSRGLIFTHFWRILSEQADAQAWTSRFMMEMDSNKVPDNNISKHLPRICHVTKLDLFPRTYRRLMLLPWNPS
jgi:hypothetical protein